jgi:hypothetical protein
MHREGGSLIEQFIWQCAPTGHCRRIHPRGQQKGSNLSGLLILAAGGNIANPSAVWLNGSQRTGPIGLVPPATNIVSMDAGKSMGGLAKRLSV